MIKSMTGYGRALSSFETRNITVEVRAVNHRYFDCTVRTPRGCAFLEDPVKKAAQSRTSRGKIDVYITVDTANGNDIEVKLNKGVFEAYLNGLRQICGEYGLEDNIKVTELASFPDTVTVVKKEIDAQQLTEEVKEVLDKALCVFDEMRTAEGEKLKEDILSRAQELEEMVGEVERLSPATVKAYREKIEQRVREILCGAQPDETRLLTEVALFADRCAVDEETVRLRSHIKQLRSMLEEPLPAGKKLDFLVQELNRETNTIGSKCADTAITNIVLKMKSEVEKIREQIQNVE